MARKLRIQYPGAIYHVMNRGDRREGLFEDDQDRQRFLQTLAEACENRVLLPTGRCAQGLTGSSRGGKSKVTLPFSSSTRRAGTGRSEEHTSELQSRGL